MYGSTPPPPGVYSYFENGCRKKCTRISRKVLWVVLKKKFERMTREATDVCLRVLKESNKSRLDSYSVRNSVLILPFGIVACTFFPTTFREIAVEQTNYTQGVIHFLCPRYFFFHAKFLGANKMHSGRCASPEYQFRHKRTANSAVWLGMAGPVPYTCTQLNHPGSGSHG